jgi:putative hydrolase of the HAD superfamily
VIRAVLFDVGGPLDVETAHEAAIDADIRAGLERAGITVDEEAWREANEFAIATFSPSVYKSVIWRLTGGDDAVSKRIYNWVEDRGHGRDLFELRPGIAKVLEALKQRQQKLGLVANQPAAVIERLARFGIGHYFDCQGVSGIYGYRKPDVRLFVRVCEDLGVDPSECLMVGDRIDNDIVPAKLLGMRTVLLRTGRHAGQQPRSWDEVPDFEVRDAGGILAAIESILKSAE